MHALAKSFDKIESIGEGQGIKTPYIELAILTLRYLSHVSPCAPVGVHSFLVWWVGISEKECVIERVTDNLQDRHHGALPSLSATGDQQLPLHTIKVELIFCSTQGSVLALKLTGKKLESQHRNKDT